MHPSPAKSFDRLPLWLSLAFSELSASRTFTLSFVLNLALGLVGLATLDAFKVAVERQVASRSQLAMGADLLITATRPITAEELEKIQRELPPGSEERWEDSLLSMISTADGKNSRLVEVRAIDDDYPFYSATRLEKQGAIVQKSTKDIVTSPHVWIPSELLSQFAIRPGASVKIGHQTFEVSDVVAQDPQAGAQGFALAPKVLIGRDFLEKTGLIGPGTRRWQSLLVKLPEGTTSATLVRQLRRAVESPDLAIRTHEAAASDMNRAVAYLSDYLGLVALVALFLAGIGSMYLFQGHLRRRAPDMAILLSLGMSLEEIVAVYVAQLGMLALFATVLTAAVSSLGLPLLPRLLAGLLPPDLTVSPSLTSLGTISLTAVLANLLACAPLLMRLKSIQPAMLFRENGQVAGLSGVRALYLLSWLPALGFYLVLAVWQSHSLKIGALFVGLLTIAGVVLTTLAGAFTSLALILRRWGSLSFELAATRLGRHKIQTLSSMAALGLGTLLLTLIPLLERFIQSELETPPESERPGLFLIDIQEEQAAPLQQAMDSLGAKMGSLAPLIRARLVKINDQPVDKAAAETRSYSMREDEESEKTLQRGFNLSYRMSLSDSAQLVAGRPFSAVFDPNSGKPAEISLEIRFAERLKVKLGDRLEFEVQGVPVIGEIVNLRRVKWTSFQPNFFIEFQPGVLDDAPKSLISAIATDAPESKRQIQQRLALDFPNVTSIDVTAVMARLLETTSHMSLALKMMALLTLLAGLGVLFAIARTESIQRQPEIMLLKALGLDFARLRITTGLEFGLLGFVSSVVGAGLAVIGAAIFAQQVFDNMGSLDLTIPSAVTFLVTVLCILIGSLATARSLRISPLRALGAQSLRP